MNTQQHVEDVAQQLHELEVRVDDLERAERSLASMLKRVHEGVCHNQHLLERVCKHLGLDPDNDGLGRRL